MKRCFAAFMCLLGLFAFGACAHNPDTADTSDPAIAAGFRQELGAHPDINVQYLDVDVHDGALTVSGVVETEEEREEIRRAAKRVPGVRQVTVNVLVRQ